MKDFIPKKPISEFKRTKIVATVGPAVESYEQIKELLNNGVNAVRFNFSHGNYEEKIKFIAWVRKASEELGKPVALIQDLQGPKIRLGDFEGIVNITSGQSLRLRYNANYEREGVLPTQYDLAKKVKRGERLYLFDGRVKTTVTSVKDGIVHVRAENDGYVISRKGINLPDTDFAGDVITAKDKKDVAFGSEHDFDYVAMSFVQTKHDIIKLKKILHNLGYQAKVIAKIETKAAIDDVEPIIAEADAVMVARGDLAIEVGPEVVPITQRKIVGLCQQYSKPSIIATQVLASMVDSPEPTRAEVGDVGTAVMIGADAVMLSEETAMGKYPQEAVCVMKRVILYTELHRPHKITYYGEHKDADTKAGAISNAILNLAEQLNVSAIVAETKSGATAFNISSYRPELPIIAVTSSERVARQLALLYGCKSFVRHDGKHQGLNVANFLREQKLFKKGDIVIVTSGMQPGVVGMTDTIKVRMLE